MSKSALQLINIEIHYGTSAQYDDGIHRLFLDHSRQKLWPRSAKNAVNERYARWQAWIKLLSGRGLSLKLMWIRQCCWRKKGLADAPNQSLIRGKFDAVLRFYRG